MTAYAAVVSLMNTLNNIQNHPRVSTFFKQKQIESLWEKLDFLLDVMENYNPHGGTREKEVEQLERLIASSVYAAEDAIESHVADQILAGSSKKGSISVLDLKKWLKGLDCFAPAVKDTIESPVADQILAGDSKGGSISVLDLKKEIKELENVMAEVMEVNKKWKLKEELLVFSKPANSSRPLSSGVTHMVGFDDHLMQLMDLLIGGQLDRRIISIIGMGGIGKTTLARNAFENVLIMQQFDVRAWVTASNEYNVRQMTLEILSYLGESISKLDGTSLDQLGELLYKKLYARRYLIVLDDVWSVEIWDKMKIFLPDNYNGSRIVVTTRLYALANVLGSSALRMNFFDEDKSWILFCSKVFAGEYCPPELEEVGKKIVQQCRGHPLSIVVIAGFLQNSSRTLEFWENVANDLNSIVNSEYDYSVLPILSLSYNNLPTHLKPCFLYMGVFPEDREIRVSQLIKLWVAEGLVKPNSHKSLEGIAKDYLQNLIDRNLILVCSFRSNGKPKTCNMHDLLRDLCISAAMKEKFLSVKRLEMMFDTPQDKNWERRIIIRGSPAENYQLLHTLESTPLARSLICDSPTVLSFKFRLLRVLVEVYADSLGTTFQQVNLRFLACESIRAPVGWTPTYELPSSISLLWNVQTFIIDKSIEKVIAPPEIWEMPQLRHLQFHRISLPDPPLVGNQDSYVLHNLQTLRTVLDFRCSKEVCRRMPNIVKLRIFYDDFSGEGEENSQYGLDNVGRFQQLESLYCCFYAVPDRNDLLQNLKFPCSLKKLVLEDCELRWSDLSIIGSLPRLEVLKLKHQAVRGPRWNTVEGHFLCLKFLEIDSCYLIHWNAESCSFPVLEKVVLSNLYKLNEIPPDIGEIPTLLSICVVDCSISVAISAVRLLKEQEEYGNEDIQVRISFSENVKPEEEEGSKKDDRQVRVGFSEKTKLEEFRERVELEELRSNNLHIDAV